jgi:hypothetical protein
VERVQLRGAIDAEVPTVDDKGVETGNKRIAVLGSTAMLALGFGGLAASSASAVSGWSLGSAPYVLRTVQDTGYTQTLSYGDGVGAPPDGSTTWSPMIYSPQHGVKAEVLVSCGDATLFAAAMDCAMNGKIDTEMK